MADQPSYTTSGSKSSDTRGVAPSTDDLREKLQENAKERAKIPREAKAKGLSGDPTSEEALDKGGSQGIG
ncbi:MAG: hypothetical protein ABW136_07365 [Steroidobacteraceae bacterium]